MKLIPLTHGKFAKVDDEDYEKFRNYSWCYAIGKHNNCGYAMRTVRKGPGKTPNSAITETFRMHREIMECTPNDGVIIDHADGDGLNNQRSNLRKSTRSQNAANRVRAFGKSKYLGVSLNKDKRNRKGDVYWMATICVNYKKHNLGRFPFTNEGEILAAKKYNEAAIKHRGEFASLNKIPEL